MTMARAPHSSEAPPLFEWQQRQRLARIEAERVALLARIERLRPRSHDRLILSHRLTELTHQALAETVALNSALQPSRAAS